MRAFLLASVAFLFSPAALAQQPGMADATGAGDIIVTATKRAERLSDVPIAVSAVSGDALQQTGASDIRQLNQLAPSLFVSSTSSEHGGASARIRGIGTVGDNVGLEASVAVFVDGVYRPRSGAGLTELGEVERIEVLRGPQGTLFGRNASAGLINVVTAKPRFEAGGNAELTLGNYDLVRLSAGVTGPVIEDRLAARLDGVLMKRDGFVTDVISGRGLNDRDRTMLRGQLLYTPGNGMELRLSGDFARRDEECCAATHLPFSQAITLPGGRVEVVPGNLVVPLLESLGAVLSDDSFARRTSITPGQGYRSKVTDWGLSGELTWPLGVADLTAITAYRDWKVSSSQDNDYNNLDLFWRSNQVRNFRTFSQEVRLTGEALDGRLDWLVGGYFAHERLRFQDNLRFGADMMDYADALVRLSVPAFPGYAALAAALGRPGVTLNGRGLDEDRYWQDSRNFAIFTHNVIDIVPDRLSLTLGARYTKERKTLDVDLAGNNTLCGALRGSAYAAFAAVPCALNEIQQFSGSTRLKEDEWTGTVVLSYKPVERLMTYASYARGYKAGGFNLDRASLDPAAIDLDSLRFGAETVDSLELGAKLDLRNVKLSLAAFRSVFDRFQLNTFNGLVFVVENIQSCRDDLGGGDSDFAPVVPDAALTGACAPDRVRGGVVSTGVEVEAALFPAPDLALNIGLTYADTRYRRNLTGDSGRPLPSALFNLPGSALSNAPEWVQTGSLAWTPAVGDGLKGLFYVDYRFQSAINTGSDLFPEKRQAPFTVVNARIGLGADDRRWAVELWAQNLLNEEYRQVVFNAPLQGSGTIARTVAGGGNSTTLFGGFLGEPRTYGVTLRTRF